MELWIYNILKREKEKAIDIFATHYAPCEKSQILFLFIAIPIDLGVLWASSAEYA